MSLNGIRVIEFAGLAPGPFCGKVLKDLGARVIRIDRTGAKIDLDRLSHGKQSIAINLKNKQGLDIVKQLANSADVLIEPYRKGVMERLGLGPKVLCVSNPRLIYARLTGYGQNGPLSERAGHDINYLSYSGVLSTLGRKGQKPHWPVNIIADFAGGGLMCALAIMSALYERTSKQANGKVLDCSMVEGAAYLSSWLWTSKDLPGVWGGSEKGENLLDGGYHAYDTYETKDGKFMACGSLEPEFYNELLEKLNLDKLEEINEETLAKVFKTKTQEEWSEIFKESDACVSPVVKLSEAHKQPHNAERNSFVALADNSGVLPSMSWLNLDPANRSFKLPKIGENSGEVLSELGFTQTQIDDLVRNKIIEVNKAESATSKL